MFTEQSDNRGVLLLWRTMQNNLTQAELSWLDTVFTQVNEEMHESLAKLGRAPLVHTLQDTAVSSLHGSSERLRRTLIKRAHAEGISSCQLLLSDVHK